MQTANKRLLPYSEYLFPFRYLLRRKLALCAVVWSFFLIVACPSAGAESLQVLHWWKSTSEHRAVDFLAGKLAQENIQWRDAVIPSGAGISAGIVLKSRVLSGNAPEVAQLNGVLIGEWAELGLLLEFDAVGSSGKWDKILFPTVWSLTQSKGHIFAAPLGIHRINTLFINQQIFKKYGLTPPRTWDEFDRVAQKLQQEGIVPLAQSSESWQLSTLFETLVLSEDGAGFYRDIFVNKKQSAFFDPRFGRALKRFRALKKWMAAPVQERSWVDVTHRFADGAAAMMVMGDWAKAELNAWGVATDTGFSCVAVPQTENYHLYDIDTLVMLAGDGSHRAAQEKLAQLVLSPSVQAEYNQIKGSVPVLRNPDMSKMDSWARASWKLFARGPSAQVPSLTHRMATDEISKDAIVAEIRRFFMDEQISVSEAQRRLGAIARSLQKTWD